MKHIPFLIIAVILFSCGGSGSRTSDNAADGNDTIAELKIKLEPLKDENLKLKGKDPFGKVIELKGEQMVIDSLIFTPSEIEMIIKNNRLLMKQSSRSNDEMFIILSFPDLRLIKTFGSRGPGPDDFMYPNLCRNTDPDILASIVETTNGKIYNVLPDGTLRPGRIPKFKSKSKYSGEYPALMTDSLFYYVANSSTGKSVFTVSGSDSIQTSEIQNLALDPKRKGWANYIGDFAINPEQTRMVYAYKYFKIVRFFDMEYQTVRTINFEREEFDESTQNQVMGMDANVTHYWGICACVNHVYMLYSGRTPAQVWNDNKKENYYIFVEKYDWNGNPVTKYKLDQWGYFTVDEENNLLYLVSTNDDDPFFIYQL